MLAAVKPWAESSAWVVGLTAAALRQVRLGMKEPRSVSLLPACTSPRPNCSGRPCQRVGVPACSGGDGELFVLGVPGPVFVVEGVGAQAAVEDADEPVRDGAKGLVVSGTASPLPVVEVPRTG